MAHQEPAQPRWRRLLDAASDIQTVFGLPALIGKLLLGALVALVAVFSLVTLISRNLWWILPAGVLTLLLWIIARAMRPPAADQTPESQFSVSVGLDRNTVVLNVQNHGPAADFEAELDVLAGGHPPLPTTPWPLRWKYTTGLRNHILSDGSALICFAELDAGWSPEYGFLNGFHGDITFYTLTDCQVAHNNLNDFRPLDVRVRVSSVTPPETITKSLRVEQRFPSKPTTAEEGVAIVESAMQGVPSIIVSVLRLTSR